MDVDEGDGCDAAAVERCRHVTLSFFNAATRLCCNGLGHVEDFSNSGARGAGSNTLSQLSHDTVAPNPDTLVRGLRLARHISGNIIPVAKSQNTISAKESPSLKPLPGNLSPVAALQEHLRRKNQRSSFKSPGYQHTLYREWFKMCFCPPPPASAAASAASFLALSASVVNKATSTIQAVGQHSDNAKAIKQPLKRFEGTVLAKEELLAVVRQYGSESFVAGLVLPSRVAQQCLLVALTAEVPFTAPPLLRLVLREVRNLHVYKLHSHVSNSPSRVQQLSEQRQFAIADQVRDLR